METETQLAFKGSEEEKQIASHAFEAMKRKGMLFAANAPIRMSLESIAKALTREGGPLAGSDPEKVKGKIETALSKNAAVFAREESGEFATTKSGRAHHAGGGDTAHTFKDRLNTEATALDADAAKEYAESLMNRAAARAERIITIDSIMDMMPPAPSPPIHHTPHITFDSATVIPQHLAPPAPAIEPTPYIEEVRPAAPPRPAAGVAPASLTPAPEPPVRPMQPAPGGSPAPQPEQPEVETRATRPEMPVAEPVAAAPSAPTTEPRTVAPATVDAVEAVGEVEEAAPPVVQPEAAPAPVRKEPAPATVETPKPAAPVVTGPIEVRVMTPDGPVAVDLRDLVDDIMADEAVATALRDMIAAAVEEDTRLVSFGSEIFPEEAIERFSKGDFRRIKDFLDEPETGGVASDREIMDYVLNRRAEHPDYDRLRFSLDYRLLKEKKDFEFVGTDSNRLWMSAGAVPVASPKRKPAEIGQDYRFLEDPAIVSVEEETDDEVLPAEPGPLDYSLTYYEYENGVLPYDRRAKRLLKGPVLEDQRAVLLQFEIPQLYTSILAELRYPTGNRGGFVMGLGDFFAEHMVPGAKLSIVPTDRADNIFEVHFNRTPEEEASLLQFDERKSRYVFKPVQFTVETDPSMLLAQEKFGKLHNQKKLEESERKRPDNIITNAFEVVGDQSDGKYLAIIDDLFPVVNIDRPISRSWLKTMLSGAYPFFYSDDTTEGAYFYDPSKRPS